MNCIPGQSVAQVRDYIEPDNWLEIASHLGEIVRDLHRIDYSSFHTTNSTKKCWKTILESERKKAIEEIQDAEKLPQKLRDELLAF